MFFFFIHFQDSKKKIQPSNTIIPKTQEPKHTLPPDKSNNSRSVSQSDNPQANQQQRLSRSNTSSNINLPVSNQQNCRLNPKSNKFQHNSLRGRSQSSTISERPRKTTQHIKGRSLSETRRSQYECKRKSSHFKFERKCPKLNSPPAAPLGKLSDDVS